MNLKFSTIKHEYSTNSLVHKGCIKYWGTKTIRLPLRLVYDQLQLHYTQYRHMYVYWHDDDISNPQTKGKI